MVASFDWASYWGYLALPSICMFGFFTNLTNMSVFLNRKMKDVSFKYLLITSLSDLMYLGLCSYMLIYLCADCPLHDSYFTKWYQIYINYYFTSVLAIFCIFSDIFLSLLRYSILKNNKYLQSIRFYLVVGLLFIVSLIYYLPVIFFYDIIPKNINNDNITTIIDEYSVVKNPLGLSLYGKITPIILSVIRLILAMIVLTSINIMNVIEFRKRYSNPFQNHSTESM